MSTITNPTAAIIVYSYKDRGGSSPISNATTEQITITKSIISIDTVKYKSRPAGSFDIKLAPTKNWTAIISPGSWIEIHMSSRLIDPNDLNKCNEDTLKMIGTIDSVRMNVSVDSTTGARRTIYSIQGRDWGSVFESFLYVDTALTNSKDGPLVNALNFLSTAYVDEKNIGVVGIFSPKDMIEKIVNLWGRNMAVLAKNLFTYAQKSKYSIPIQLALKLSAKSQYVADNINIISGKLISKDAYVPANESLGVLNPLMLLGPHAVWQLLTAHSNYILNELVAELRWEGEAPDFTLYHRIKPFQVKSNKPAYFSSNFFNIKQNTIPNYDIVSIDVGDNAQDVVNFIEILPDMSLSSLPPSISNGIIAASKPDSSIIDPESLARHGLKPLTYSSVFAPSNGGYLNWLGVKNWLPVLRDWYFDCHKMLNGTIVVLGQEKYIGVGENIVIDSSIFGNANFINAGQTKFVAHVESVSHSFAYEPQRGRTFVTKISFVRGVFADHSASKLTDSNSFGIETDSSALPDYKKDIDNVYLE